MTTQPEHAGLNDVRILGRLGHQVAIKELPSGDVITTFTVIVPRHGRVREGRPKVDSLACQAWRAGVRAKVEQWPEGTWVEVEGSLRRRFWQAGHGLASATEIEVRSLVRVRESSGVAR